MNVRLIRTFAKVFMVLMVGAILCLSSCLNPRIVTIKGTTYIIPPFQSHKSISSALAMKANGRNGHYIEIYIPRALEYVPVAGPVSTNFYGNDVQERVGVEGFPMYQTKTQIFNGLSTGEYFDVFTYPADTVNSHGHKYIGLEIHVYDSKLFGLDVNKKMTFDKMRLVNFTDTLRAFLDLLDQPQQLLSENTEHSATAYTGEFKSACKKVENGDEDTEKKDKKGSVKKKKNAKGEQPVQRYAWRLAESYSPDSVFYRVMENMPMEVSCTLAKYGYRSDASYSYIDLVPGMRAQLIVDKFSTPKQAFENCETGYQNITKADKGFTRSRKFSPATICPGSACPNGINFGTGVPTKYLGVVRGANFKTRESVPGAGCYYLSKGQLQCTHVVMAGADFGNYWLDYMPHFHPGGSSLSDGYLTGCPDNPQCQTFVYKCRVQVIPQFQILYNNTLRWFPALTMISDLPGYTAGQHISIQRPYKSKSWLKGKLRHMQGAKPALAALYIHGGDIIKIH